SGHYFGPKHGGNESVSGYYDRVFNGRRDSEWLQIWVDQLRKRGWDARRGGDYLAEHGSDGHYGSEHEELIRAFQEDQGLVVDGLLGPVTWRAAFENPVTSSTTTYGGLYDQHHREPCSHVDTGGRRSAGGTVYVHSTNLETHETIRRYDGRDPRSSTPLRE